jgi:Mg2+-importing ATPase
VRPDHPAILAKSETLAELMRRLATSPAGLSSEEARARAERRGTPELPDSAWRPMARELLRAVLNPLTLILLLAAAAARLVGQAQDAGIIASIVGLSTGLSFFQSFRSERAVRALRRGIAPSARALRDGVLRELPREELVLGDVIQLAAGALVPADARVIAARDLHVQQAALTGESLPAEKTVIEGVPATLGPDSPGFVYLGTSIVSGTGAALIFATGRDTAFGDIVERLSARPEETEFDRGLSRFSRLVLDTVLFLVLFVLVVSLSLGRGGMQSLLFSVALAVGLTPGFLPVVSSVTLAQGAARMARQKVIVKHLPAIQNLGSIDVLCSDKTGTLTAGAPTLEAALDAFGAPSERTLLFAYLNSRFETGIQSPLDAAILERRPAEADGFEKTDELPFDFERRRVSVVVEKAGQLLLIAKGAPEGVLAACSSVERGAELEPLESEQRRSCEATFRRLSERGLRVLAVASKTVTEAHGLNAGDERDLALVGFVTFVDRPLEGVAETLARLHEDGVEIKILTGDNELVTRYVCAEVGIDAERPILGQDLDRLDPQAFAHVVETERVFCRVSPAQKHRIIEALRGRGHVVGFMGDGINDAPSLHAADVGISVAGAADIARDASDIILLERRLDVLHQGILAGRKASGNVLKYLLMGTSSNFGNMFSMAGAVMFLPFLPMLPTQILLNNFLYDAAQLTIPTDRVDPFYVRRPARWDIGLIRNFMLLVGPISSLYDFLTFYVLLQVFRFDERRFQTGWFLESLATQTLVLFVIRTAGKPWHSRPSLALTVTISSIVALSLALPYSPLAGEFGLEPLPARYFAFLLVTTASYLVLVEAVKERVMRRFAATG